jgi:Trk K+ transport system NAD-binding subunit
MNDDVNLRICQAAEMSFDVPRLIARVNNRANVADFELLGYEVMSLARAAATLLNGAELKPSFLRLLREGVEMESIAEVAVISPVNVGRRSAPA